MLLAASAVADLAAASMLNADVISAMSEAALDLLTPKVIVATRSAPTWPAQILAELVEV